MVAQAVVKAGQPVLHGDAGQHLVDVGKVLPREEVAQRHGQRVGQRGHALDAHQVQAVPHGQVAHGVLHEVQRHEQVVLAGTGVLVRVQLRAHGLALKAHALARLPGEHPAQPVGIAVHAQAHGGVQHAPRVVRKLDQPPVLEQLAVQHQADALDVDRRQAAHQRLADFLDGLAAGQLVLQGAEAIGEVGDAGGAPDVFGDLAAQAVARVHGVSRGLAQHQRRGRADSVRNRLARPDPAHGVHAGVAHVPAELVHGCDGGGQVGGHVGVVKAGDHEVVGDAVAGGLRRVAHAQGDVVVGADDGLGHIVVVAPGQRVKGVHAAFDDEALREEAVLPAGQAVFRAIVDERLGAAPVFVVVRRPHREPEVRQAHFPVQIADHGAHGVVVVDAHVVERLDVVGHGDHGLARLRRGHHGVEHAPRVGVGVGVQYAVDVQQDAVEVGVVRQAEDVVFAAVVLGGEVGIAVAADHVQVHRLVGQPTGAIQPGNALVSEFTHAVVDDVQHLFHASRLCFALPGGGSFILYLFYNPPRGFASGA